MRRSRIVAATLVGAAVLASGYALWHTRAGGLVSLEAGNATPATGTTPAASDGAPAGNAIPSSAAAAPGSPSAKASAAPASSPKARSKAPAGPVKTAKVMVLGDSISSGAQDEVMDGYRLDLLQLLQGYPIDYVGSYSRGDDRLADKDMQAEGGACIRSTPCDSTDMYEQTAGWIRAAQPNVVIMQGGGNDYCCGNQNKPDSVVIQAMTDWINLIWATKPDVYIVVIGMVDYHYGYKDWIPKYVAQQAAAGKHISYVSFDGVSTYDTVHPNIAGYQTLANRLAPVVKPILRTLEGR